MFKKINLKLDKNKNKNFVSKVKDSQTKIDDLKSRHSNYDSTGT